MISRYETTMITSWSKNVKYVDSYEIVDIIEVPLLASYYHFL